MTRLDSAGYLARLHVVGEFASPRHAAVLRTSDVHMAVTYLTHLRIAYQHTIRVYADWLSDERVNVSTCAKSQISPK